MLVQIIGYVASILVFIAFFMRTMLPLRYVAVASNIAFICWSLPLKIWPVLILHSALLPLNLLRLLQIRGLVRQIGMARGMTLDVGPLAAGLQSERHPAGTVLFKRGDKGDAAFLLAKGEVEIVELHVKLGEGQLFGEVALLSPDGVRTATVMCATDVELYRIDALAFGRAFYQDPAFAFALVRLATGRLVENMRRLEAGRVAGAG
jgi:CRP/FNR family transcriptional regulator, cyclic AMP receptor protein